MLPLPSLLKVSSFYNDNGAEEGKKERKEKQEENKYSQFPFADVNRIAADSIGIYS